MGAYIRLLIPALIKGVVETTAILFITSLAIICVTLRMVWKRRGGDE